jgi:Bax protein
MSWICSVLLICSSFNPVMDYTNNDEFISDVKACALHLNSLLDDHERIPVNLVIAQAIHESEWGKSRFAVEGNNLLGIRTFDPADDQIKPLNKPNATWGLRIFETKCESIAYYMWLLNYNHHYYLFREEKISQYINDIMDLELLATTLAIYAEDIYYTQKIIKTLKYLEAYDRD